MAAAPFGSALILPISFAYISMMGSKALAKATKLSVLHANYMAKRLGGAYPVLFTNSNGRCAHEFILDLRCASGPCAQPPANLPSLHSRRRCALLRALLR